LWAVAFVAIIFVSGGAAVMMSETDTRNEDAVQQGEACLDSWYAKCLAQELGAVAARDPKAALEMYRVKAETDTRLREVCHDLFHNIGRGAAVDGTDPWDVFMVGTSECNWGYVHGAVEGYLEGDAASVIARAETLCTPRGDLSTADPYVSSVAGNCVHGTGHALFRAKEDPIAAEAGCREAFSAAQSALACIDGMIMQFGNSDAAKAGAHSDICARIQKDAKKTCYRNIALTWYYQSNGDYLGVLRKCGEAIEDDLIYHCAWGAGNLFTVQHGFDLAAMGAICDELDGAYLRGCYTGASVAAALGVNTAVLTEAELDAFVARSANQTWFAELQEEIKRAKNGFGAAAK
jgi:hypothetical protein